MRKGVEIFQFPVGKVDMLHKEFFTKHIMSIFATFINHVPLLSWAICLRLRIPQWFESLGVFGKKKKNSITDDLSTTKKSVILVVDCIKNLTIGKHSNKGVLSYLPRLYSKIGASLVVGNICQTYLQLDVSNLSPLTFIASQNNNQKVLYQCSPATCVLI